MGHDGCAYTLPSESVQVKILHHMACGKGVNSLTLEELSKHLALRERLVRDEEILEALKAAASPGGQVLTGMPHVQGVKDRVGTLAIEIADMKERIQHLHDEILEEESIVQKFIYSINDEYLRTLFRLRFIRGLAWGEVAAVIGGRNTEHGVKSACYRFLQRNHSR
jgi:hypothetical protein